MQVKPEVSKAHSEREGGGRMSSEFRVLSGRLKRASRAMRRERGTRAHSGILFSYGTIREPPLAHKGNSEGSKQRRESRKEVSGAVKMLEKLRTR
jgi:hypothetical protein